jgi:hypothetical protein
MDAMLRSLILVLLFTGLGTPATNPPSAAEIMAAAKAQAAAQGKPIFLIFGASW